MTTGDMLAPAFHDRGKPRRHLARTKGTRPTTYNRGHDCEADGQVRQSRDLQSGGQKHSAQEPTTSLNMRSCPATTYRGGQ